MTILVKQEAVPSDLPPANLYLDDIEEVLRIFRALGQPSEAENSEVRHQRVYFDLGDEVCDDISDLEKIGGRAAFLTVRLIMTGPHFRQEFGLRIDRVSTSWINLGSEEENEWKAYRRLKALFDLRKRKWRAFVDDFRALTLLATGGMVALLSLVGVVLRQHVAVKPSITITPVWISALFAALFVFLTFRNHSVVQLRRRPTRATLGDMIRRNEVWLAAILGAVAGAIAGGAATVVAERLIRKWWP
jgi:hypothetical protein